MPATIHFYDAVFIGSPATGQLVGFDSLACTSSGAKSRTMQIKLRPDVSFRPASIEQHECFGQNLSEGISEYQWSRSAEEIFSTPSALHVGVGNTGSLDNAIRFALYRSLSTLPNTHLMDGSSYLDLLTVSRAMRVLRPNGMQDSLKHEWSEQRRRSVIFGTTELNGRALAVKEYAGRLNSMNPTLFNHAIQLSNPERIGRALGLSCGNVDSVDNLVPVFICHESLPEKDRHGVYMAIGTDPIYAGMVYMVDLTCDLTDLIERGHRQPADFIRQSVAEKHLPVVRVNLNRVPFVSPLGVLNGEAGKRLGISAAFIKAQVELLRSCTDLCLSYMELSTAGTASLNADPDSQLLSGEYLATDLRLLKSLHMQDFETWRLTLTEAHDERIPLLAHRVLARDAMDTFDHSESADWLKHCKKRLLSSASGDELESDTKYCRNVLSDSSLPIGMRSACEHWIRTSEATNE